MIDHSGSSYNGLLARKSAGGIAVSFDWLTGTEVMTQRVGMKKGNKNQERSGKQGLSSLAWAPLAVVDRSG